MKKLALWMLVMCTTFGLSSCEEDYWWGSYGDDPWVTENIVGTWRIVEVTPQHGYEPPYVYGDRMVFWPDGLMRSYGVNLNEEGYWEFYNRYLHFDFNGDGRDDTVAYVSQMDRNYMVLDVTEYDEYGTRYRLRLTYDGNYYTRKK